MSAFGLPKNFITNWNLNKKSRRARTHLHIEPEISRVCCWWCRISGIFRLLTKNFIYFGLQRLNCPFRAQIKKLFYKLVVDLSQDPSLTNIFLKYICLVGRNLYVLFPYNLNYKLCKDTRQAVWVWEFIWVDSGN